MLDQRRRWWAHIKTNSGQTCRVCWIVTDGAEFPTKTIAPLLAHQWPHAEVRVVCSVMRRTVDCASSDG